MSQDATRDHIRKVTSFYGIYGDVTDKYDPVFGPSICVVHEVLKGSDPESYNVSSAPEGMPNILSVFSDPNTRDISEIQFAYYDGDIDYLDVPLYSILQNDDGGPPKLVFRPRDKAIEIPSDSVKYQVIMKLAKSFVKEIISKGLAHKNMQFGTIENVKDSGIEGALDIAKPEVISEDLANDMLSKCTDFIEPSLGLSNGIEQ